MNSVSIHKRNLFFATSCLVLVSMNTPPVVAGECCGLSEDPTTATSPQFGETLGSSVAIDGTLAVAGAPLYDVGGNTDAGRAVVFSFTGSIWVQDDVVIATDADINDRFGFSVAMDGGVIVVGSPFDDLGAVEDAGSVYVFEDVGGSWTQVAKLTIKLPAQNDEFGWSVAISGDTIIASARGRDVDETANAGAVYWFDKPGGGWADKEGEDFFSEDTLNNFDVFGFSIALDGNVAIVGAPGWFVGPEQAGGAFIFRRNGSIWDQEQVLEASDAFEDDNFGKSVSIEGDIALVGAPFNTHNLIDDSGAAYAYHFDSELEIWTDEQILSACDPLEDDQFGTSVSISGEVAVVGSTQPVGIPSGDGRADAFGYFGAGWARLNQLTASDAGEDRFGFSVSIDGDRAMVGAFAWDVGVTGNHGAIYGFDGFDTADACDCPWDLDGNGVVGASDLLALLAAWGDCPDPPAECPADFDGDDSVGASDLLALLANWGPCINEAIPLRNAQDCIDKFYPDDMSALIACIEAFGG